MSYKIKKSFKASDLRVGDLMYDALEDVMVRVVFVTEAIQKKITQLNVFDLDFSTKTIDVQLKQFVLENMEDKSIFMIDVIGKEGKLPVLENNKPRFRHHMRIEEVTIFNYPSCPNYYPYYSYPNYPHYWYPDYTFNPYCSPIDSSDHIISGTTTYASYPISGWTTTTTTKGDLGDFSVIGDSINYGNTHDNTGCINGNISNCVTSDITHNDKTHYTLK